MKKTPQQSRPYERWIIIGGIGLFVVSSIFWAWLAFLLTAPRTYYVTTAAESIDKKYQLQVKYVDYGGSSSGCSVGYGEGIPRFKLWFGKMCGGISLHSFLIKKNIVGLGRVYELEKIPHTVPCGSQGGICGTATVERLEDFEVLNDHQILWYGETIEYK